MEKGCLPPERDPHSLVGVGSRGLLLVGEDNALGARLSERQGRWVREMTA